MSEREGPWALRRVWCQVCLADGDHVTELHAHVAREVRGPIAGLREAEAAAREVLAEASRAGPSDALPPAVGSRAWMAAVMEAQFDACRALRGAGQAEYARRDENAFANFDRVGERQGLSPERVLLVYLEKHLNGIAAHVAGHESQREGVEGRIGDAIVYLCLLRGLVERRRAGGAP